MAASEEKPLSAFPTAAQVLLTTLLFGSVVNITATSGYDSVKITASDLAEAILGDFQYTQDLETDAKTIFNAINSVRVLSGTATPAAATGANDQLYVKYTVDGNDDPDAVTGLYFKIAGDWLEISTGGGGGAAVAMGTTEPAAASGSNGDLYIQYDATTYAFVELFVKINNSWRKSPYSRVVALTQAEYAQITPDPTTLYIITDAQSSYQTKSDNSLDTDDKTVVGAINELNGRFDYSTTEKAVGTWVDGKTIYKKTLYIASMPDGSTASTEYLFLNTPVDMIVDYSAILFTQQRDQFLPLPYVFTSLATANMQFGFIIKSDNKLYLNVRSGGIDRSSSSGYVTAYYTKVTT